MLAGILLGVVAYGAGHAFSGRLEPFDSGTGLLATQVVLGCAAVLAGWRAGGRALALLLLGSYIGVNVYPYVVGGSESRAWAALGALTSMTLVALPALLGALAFVIGRAGRGAAP
ncbi:MAG: hypothetical protein FIB06_10545 [Betaproteobacteria bacterium]|nr:hypothetical protein [Betaproteobacteria bacterium]